MMPYEQKPKTASIIEPATMEKIEAMMEKQVDGYHCTAQDVDIRQKIPVT